MEPPRRPVGLSILAAVFVLSAVGTIAFWLDWFWGGHVATDADSCYLAFENAFPFADGIMCVFLLLAAAGFMRLRDTGFLYGLIAAGHLWSLGCLDTLYNLEHGKYADMGDSAMAFEAYINVHCFTLSAAAVWYIWTRRAHLLNLGGAPPEQGATRPRSLTGLAYVLCVTAAGIVVFWAYWFAVDRAAHADQPCVVIFEDTFPLADGIVAVTATLTVAGILRRRPWAVLWGLVTGGALLFLASMDALFYVQHQRWTTPDGPAMAIVILGLYAVAWWSLRSLWTQRAWLLHAGEESG